MNTTTRTRARPYMSPREAAEILGIQPDSVRNQIESGRLEGRKFGRCWRVLRRSVAQALAASRHWRKAAESGTMLATYATPSGGVVTLWRCGAAFHTAQRFADGTMEHFDLAGAEAARLHYEYAQMVGVVAGSFPVPAPGTPAPAETRGPDPTPAQAADGKRRCSHPGCSTILSRFNDGDACALHA